MSLEARDSTGRTVLMRAAEGSDSATLQWILETGAEIDAKLVDGRTPLMLAAGRGRRAAVRALLAAGADPRRMDSSGRDAAALAELAGDRALAEGIRGGPWRARRPRSDSGLRRARGLGALDGNDTSLLVEASPARVSHALVGYLGASLWVRDAYGHEVSTTPRCCVVFRFRGHRWTIVREAQADTGPWLRLGVARWLAGRLETRSLWVDHRPEQGVASYLMFDQGRVREWLGDLGTEVSGAVGLRRDGRPDGFLDRWGDDPQRWIHRRLVDLDAFTPSWGRRRGALQRLEIAGLTSDDFDRLDFVAIPGPESLLQR